MDLSVYRYSTQEGRNYGSSLSRAATSGRSRRIPHRYGDDVGEHVPLGARKTPHDAQQDGEGTNIVGGGDVNYGAEG